MQRVLLAVSIVLSLSTFPCFAFRMMMRSIVGRIRATKNAKSPIVRIVGSIDVHGQGTLHPLTAVDPIVLCDYAEIIGKGLPPFGMHPHFGVIACTIVIEGEYTDQDNLNASPSGNTCAGGVYAASAGRGVCHDETSVADYNRLFQVVVRIPASQLSLPPQITKATADDLPQILPGVTLLFGEMEGAKSPATPEAWPDAVFLRVKVPVGSNLSVPLPEHHVHGFGVVIDGSGTVAGEPVSKNQEAILFGAGKILDVAGGLTEELDMFVASGAPMNDEPWVKKLGNNGFGIFRNEQEAIDIMGKAVAAGKDWSYKILDDAASAS
jgi:redox-sensitive bicupin YhaK (pirin superfamily)